MNDYVIAFDASGQPYISHAFWNRNKGGQKKEHKYIQRIKDKNGLWRYFYDEEEWQAYLKGKTDHVDSIGGKIKDKLGYDEKKRMQDAKKNRDRAAEYVNEEFNREQITENKTNAKRMEAASLSLGKSLVENKPVNTPREYVKKKKTINAFNKEIKKVIPELEKANNAIERRHNSRKSAETTYINAQTAYANAINEYGKTPIGFIDTLLGKKPKWHE